MYMPNDFSFNELNAGRVAAPRAAAVTCFATRRVAQLASVVCTVVVMSRCELEACAGGATGPDKTA